MNKTDIEYLDYTWNPLAMLCTRTESPGCLNCWHQNFAKRHAANPLFSRNDRAAWAGKGPPVLRLDELEAPSKLKKPSRIGVQFMGDLFHEKVSHKQLTRIFSAMSYDAPQHTYMVLTKRPERAREYFEPWLDENEKYLWLGISASTQDDLDRWVPVLIQIPAAKRFVSLEPLLGLVDVKPYLRYHSHGIQGHRKLDLIIAGGESGPGARPSHPGWFRKVRDDCAAAGAPFMFKQWGEFIHGSQIQNDSVLLPLPKDDKKWAWAGKAPNAVMMCRVGKKAAGRELDGQIHDGWPEE